MVDTLFKYEGTLDKFMGDGIMAIWGAPVSHPDDAIRSISCALEMGEVLGDFNRRRLERDQKPLAVGIGIHTGPLVAGYIGSSKALSYTVIGDVANTSARICSAALAGQILISEPTQERLGGRFELDELQPVTLKGISSPCASSTCCGRASRYRSPRRSSGPSRRASRKDPANAASRCGSSWRGFPAASRGVIAARRGSVRPPL